MRLTVRMRRLVLPEALYERIVDDARGSPEREICGLLAGSGDTCTAAYPVKNVSPTPECAFYMDPQSQIDAMGAMDRCGETMLGIYHSHPRTEARPSARDIAGAAYPGVAYLIISLKHDTGPRIAAFDFVDGRFESLNLAIGRGSGALAT